jgi:PIN domain nuclease of toxin-antitoxin system
MKTPVVCDTHALIYWSLAPKRLGAGASQSIEQARKQGEIFCADISLWEIAMLVEKGRLELGVAAEEYLDNLVTALGPVRAVPAKGSSGSPHRRYRACFGCAFGYPRCIL